MYAQRYIVSLTTAADGSATGYTPVVTGKIAAISYVKTDFADGVDFVVSGEDSGLIIWDEDNVNASAIRAPKQATHLNTSGAAALYAAGGAAVLSDIMIANERTKVVVASGGDTKTGAVHIIVA